MQNKNEFLSIGKQYLITFLVALIWLFVGASFFILPIVFKYKGTNFDINNLEGELFLLSSIASLLGIGVIVSLFFKQFKDDIFSWKKNWLKNIIIIIVGIGIIIGSSYLFEFIYSCLNIEGTSENQNIIVNALKSSDMGYVVIYSVILAPIFEEIVFRKLLFSTLRKNTKFPLWACVLVSAVFFALIHVVSDLQSMVFFFEYFALALVISSSYALSNENIYVTILLHFLNNLISLLMILL